ncbi:hypothetical protein D0Z07_1444 [Hyphodiscus hymeniophilus]|uniref:CRIB domain-containing protein n=1 Tax=Hyphodiscus hymeniophilus TaxID=353542 RepID=A0A9P6VR31_9HELO|nr:hypothetical protein D0Z07_1444 [Hyphodiscus hymeniophilus]
MFSFGSGKSAYSSANTVAERRKSPKNGKSSPASQDITAQMDSLQPAIDGPPSPERIRAYTEQMKRSSIFGNNSRTNTLSSATSSFRSRDSDTTTLSRKSSNRSIAGSMPSSRGDRPESVFGKSIFSRAGRRARREGNSPANSATSLTTGEDGTEERTSARENYYGKDSRKIHVISEPYNFQHVTHTRPDHVSDLGNAHKYELESEFSALRASQPPTSGELKGIRTQDLHFDNFSSEALSAPTLEDWRSEISPQRERALLRKPVSPPQTSRYLNYAKSVDNLRSPPPRPPRSPLSPTCPVALPARTSSRTASILFDTFDPLATTTIERPPSMNGGFRRPAPLVVPARPPPLPLWSEQQHDHFSDQPVPQAVTTPGDEAWPLITPGGNFGDLADVQEEEEDYLGSRRSRISTASAELRASKSVPALRMRSYEQAMDRPETSMSTTLGRSPSSGTVIAPKSPLTPGFDLNDDWEKDVDYCYENELEADCDYQWDKCSVEDNAIANAPQPLVEQPSLKLHLEDDHRSVYHGRFRPSLLVPSAYEVPELSPMSSESTTSDPRTPSNFLRPGHVRSPSHASSFKESHGFNLSPSLLIPSDFQSQIDQDSLYDDHFRNHTTSVSIFAPDPYNHSISPFDEATSSTASYRSSNFSRGSARSSSSTRISGAHSRTSQDSVLLLSRAASVSRAHRSVSSASSLPDLIPSSMRRSVLTDFDLAASSGSLDMEVGDEIVRASPEPEIVDPSSGLTSLSHRRYKSLGLESVMRKGMNHFAPPPALLPEVEQYPNLSPVAESFIVETPKEKVMIDSMPQVHGRKTSAPVISPSTKEFKGRTRAATSAGIGGKKRGSYMLFPQI